MSKFLLRIRQISVQIWDPKSAILTEIFTGFPQSPQPNAGIAP
jgi:hypothetical protein